MCLRDGALGVLLALTIGCAPTPAEQEVSVLAPVLENGSFTAELNGHSIHYQVHGDGPALMVVPNSWGLSLDGLRGLFQPLEDNLTLVYFDPRGMGDSGPIRDDADMGMATVRDDFDALRRHLGLQAVDAIGWSNGAMNLIVLAAERPETIRSAVFVHGAASFDEEDMRRWEERQPDLMARWAELDRKLRADEMTDGGRTAELKKFWVGEFFPGSCADPEAAAPKLQELYRDVEFSWSHADYANREAPVFDARDQLDAITARCLVIAGAHDNFPPEKVRELADGLSDARFVVFEHSGHFAPIEEPEAFRTAVLEFLVAS